MLLLCFNLMPLNVCLQNDLQYLYRVNLIVLKTSFTLLIYTFTCTIYSALCPYSVKDTQDTCKSIFVFTSYFF